MEIKRNGSQPSGKGLSEWFTGNVRIDPLHQADAPARVSIVEQMDGKGADWMEHVSDEQYQLVSKLG